MFPKLEIWILSLQILMLTAPSAEATGCNHGDFIPDGFDCTIYYRCDHGRMIQFKCPTKLLWNQNLLTCDWPKNVRCKSNIQYSVDKIDYPQGTPRTASTSNMKYKAETGNRGDYKVICYFKPPSDLNRRHDDMQIEEIDATLCTHIIFDHAIIDERTRQIKFPDDWMTNSYELFHQIKRLKSQNPNLKVLLRLGNWDQGQDGYSKVTSNPRCRVTFATKVIDFLHDKGFDGLELNWEYPVCKQGNCDPDKTYENEDYAMLMYELQTRFKVENPPLILAASIPSCQKIIKISFNRDALSEYVDFMTVETHKSHQHWEIADGEEKLLYSRPNDRNLCLTSNCTMHWLAQMGIPREKLIMGINTYGLLYTLPITANSGSKKTVQQAVEVPTEPTEISYNEICKIIQDPSWNVVSDENNMIGPHAFKNNEWIAYNNPSTIANEARAVKRGNFGGVALQTIDMDDHQGNCGRKPFPLLRSVKCAFKKQQRNG